MLVAFHNINGKSPVSRKIHLCVDNRYLRRRYRRLDLLQSPVAMSSGRILPKTLMPLFVETVPIDSPGRLRLSGHRLDFAPKSVWPQSSPGTALLPVVAVRQHPRQAPWREPLPPEFLKSRYRRRYFGPPSPRVSSWVVVLQRLAFRVAISASGRWR